MVSLKSKNLNNRKVEKWALGFKINIIFPISAIFSISEVMLLFVYILLICSNMTGNIRLDFSVVPIKHRVKVGPLTILSLFSKLVSKSVSQ